MIVISDAFPLDRLRTEANFWISPPLYQTVLTIANESV